MSDTSFPIDIDTRPAEAAVKKLGASLDKFAGLAVAAIGVLGGRAVIGAIGGFISAASDAEKAGQGVASSLARMGQLSAANLSEIDDFTKRLSDLKGIEDDAAAAAFSLASSFGLTKDQALKVVDAAADMAAATGKDLESSVQLLAKSFDGTAGALKELNPQMRNLSEDALKAGAAVEVAMRAFGGAAAAQLETFGGAVNQTKNAFGNLEESLGNLIVKNPAVIEVVQKLGEIFGKLTGMVDRNADGIRDFIKDALVGAIEMLADFLPALKAPVAVLDAFAKIGVRAAFGVIELVKAIAQFQGVQSAVKAIAGAFLEVSSAIADVLKFVLKVPQFFDIDVSGIELALEGMQIAAKETENTLVDVDLMGKLDATQQALVTFGDAGTEAFDAISQAIDDSAKATKGFARELDKLPASTPAPGAGLKNQTGGWKPDAAQGFGGSIGMEQVFEPLLIAVDNAGASFLRNIGGGEAGARQFVTDFLVNMTDGVIETFGLGGPIAGATAAMFQMLGQDPETFGKMIDGFVKGIPTIIDNIVENVPTLILAIANNSGEIITALVNASPRIIVALAQAMPEVALALISELTGGLNYQGTTFSKAFDKAIADITGAGERFKGWVDAAGNKFQAAWDGFERNATAIVGRMFDGIEEFFESFGTQFRDSVVDAAKGFIKPLSDFFNGLTGSGGDGSGGYVGQTLDRWGVTGNGMALREMAAPLVGDYGNAGYMPRPGDGVAAQSQRPIEIRLVLNQDVIATALVDLDTANARVRR